MGFLGRVFRRPRAYRWSLRAARLFQRVWARKGWIARLPGYGRGWTTGRDFPAVAQETFRDWWGKREAGPEGRRGGSAPGGTGAREGAKRKEEEG